MPTALLDYQHELLAETDASGLVFGRVGTPYFSLEHPQLVPGDEKFGDVEFEREDGVTFGEDYSTGKTVVFELGVGTWDQANPHVSGADALEALERAWKNTKYRQSASSLAVLRSRAVPGRTRRAYGRPRRYAESTSRTSHKGYSTVLCDFQTIDGKWYDDVAQTQTVRVQRLPIGTTSSGSFGGFGTTITVNGSAAAWPVLTINGPVNKGFVRVGEIVVGFTQPILVGESVTFDPRPWKRTCLRQDGANFAGKLHADSSTMRKSGLNRGTYQFAFIGEFGPTTSSAATCTVTWRNAYMRW